MGVEENDIAEGRGAGARDSVFARVLDPGTGAKERQSGDPERCLNCGAPLAGAYCHACGQAANIHRSIGGILHDLLHGALHFEGRLWRTLPLLVFTPGRLTRCYIEGARARFVSPMALFLFSIFLMFAVFQLLGIGARENANLEVAINEQAAPQASPDRGQADVTTGVGWIDEGIVAKWRENPDLMFYKLQANSYKFSWLLIPLSVPFVWLLFAWRRRFKAYDHAIFVTYSLSFMTLLFVTLSLLGAAGLGGGWIFAITALTAPWHLYRQLRGSYHLSRFSAIWRLIALIVLIWMIVLIFLQALLIVGAF